MIAERSRSNEIVMPDGNEAGRRCALSVFETVGTERAVRWVKLDDEHQPTDYQSDGLFRMLSVKQRFTRPARVAF